jgi:hypothetical protein
MLADPHDCPESRFVERQLWLDLPGALHEQLDCAVLGQIRQALRQSRLMRVV